MLLQDVLQDVVVAVSVCPQVLYLCVAPLQAGRCYAVAVFRAGQAVDSGVGLLVVEPLPFVDAGICRILARDESESSDDAFLLIQAYVAVACFYILLYQLFGGVSACPLLHVPAFSHDAFALFEDVHQAVDFFYTGFSD